MSADRAESLFRERFGGDPDGAWQAPGRVNLIGEHTDYNDGFVLPFAIDRRADVAVRLRDDRLLRVVSTFEERVFEADLDALGDGGFEDWSAYPFGVAWAFGDAGFDLASAPGFDLAVDSDVPVGAGLSSSAAIEMAAAVALNDLWRAGFDDAALARIGQRAENVVVGAPTGILDQSASMFGRADEAVFLDCRSLAVQQVPLGFRDAGFVVLAVDTRVEHDHATGGYRDRRESCERGARELGVLALRDMGVDDLPNARRLLDPVTFRRVRHIVTEDARVLESVEALRAHDLPALGALLFASHASMRDDFEISVSQLDLVVETAREAGALGARMTGGGFGGTAIALVREEQTEPLADAVRAAFADAGFREPAGFTVAPSSGAGRARPVPLIRA